MDREMQKGLFGLFEDYKAYHQKDKPVIKQQKKKHKPVKKEADGKHYDYGQPLSLSGDYAEDIDYEPVDQGSSRAMNYFPPSDALRYDLEQHGQEVESFGYAEDYVEEDPYAAAHATVAKPMEPAKEEEKPVPAPADHAIEEKPIKKAPEKPALVDKSTLDDDEAFEEDLRAILSGKKQYKEPKSTGAKPKPNAVENILSPPKPKQDEEQKDEHAIFEKIAQSMRLANAYDLGALELERRFDAFDAAQEEKK